MNVNFDGKTAVVTGAASGLGREVTKLLLGGGARVIGFDLAPVDEPGVEGRKVDIGDPASIDAAVALLDAPVDVLCNVAGLPQTKPAIDVVKVNFLGLRHLTEALAPTMAEGATVTNVASAAGGGWAARREVLEELLDTPAFADGLAWTEANVEAQGDSYTFSKELVQLYTLRRSHTLFRDHGVRMNAVSPGILQTNMTAEFRKAVSDKGIDGVAQGSTMGRIGSPVEVAPALAFLASSFSSYCSGSIFVVDGGWGAVTATDQVDYGVFA